MPFPGQNDHDSESPGMLRRSHRRFLLIFEAIFRLAIPMVDGIHKPTSNARPHLHNPQRISQIRTSHRMGDDVLRLHLHVTKNGDRSTKTSTSIEAIEDTALGPNVRDRRAGSNVAPSIPRRDKCKR